MEIVFSLVLAMSGECLYNNSELFKDVYKAKGEKTNYKKEHSTTGRNIFKSQTKNQMLCKNMSSPPKKW